MIVPLRWLGRQGTRAIAAIVLLAVVSPAMGAVLQPFVSEAVFVLLCISFLRVDAGALRTQLRRPGWLVVALAWVSLVPPLLMGGVCLALDVPALAPALFVGPDAAVDGFTVDVEPGAGRLDGPGRHLGAAAVGRQHGPCP